MGIPVTNFRNNFKQVLQSVCIGTFAVLLVGAFTLANAQLFESKAKQAYLIDAETGTIFYQKNAEKPMPPASMAKLMTIEAVFHALKTGRLSLTDEFLVSEKAWREGGSSSGGSTMFLKLNSSVSVEDLVRGVVIQSGNDASIVLAEGMAGSERIFADLMNQRAKKIGLENSIFRNSTGLPDPQQRVTAKDLAKLALFLMEQYPEYYPYFAEPDFKWNKINQRNRNPLLNAGIGADGLKTGHTEESGYGLVGSAKKDDRRLVVVVNGLESERDRNEEARKLLTFGFQAFKKIALFDKDEIVGEAKMFGGDKTTVELKANERLQIFAPIGNIDRLKAKIVYEGPIIAPVEEGDQIATLKVWIGDSLSQETPLYAAESIGPGTIPQRAKDALGELIIGFF